MQLQLQEDTLSLFFDCSYAMADPLSITLAAITLATALKDMIELAQKLKGSFEEVRSRTEGIRMSSN